jgi:glutathione S-transferase
VLRWSIAALNSIELPLLSYWFVNLSGGRGTKPSEALKGWAEMRLKQLDGWLSNREFVATEDFTVADILTTHVLDAGTPKEMLKAFPNLVAYRARCTGRPAWKKTLDAYYERVEAA